MLTVPQNPNPLGAPLDQPFETLALYQHWKKCDFPFFSQSLQPFIVENTLTQLIWQNNLIEKTCAVHGTGLINVYDHLTQRSCRKNKHNRHTYKQPPNYWAKSLTFRFLLNGDPLLCNEYPLLTKNNLF